MPERIGRTNSFFYEIAPAMALLTILLVGLAVTLVLPSEPSKLYTIIVAPWANLHEVLTLVQDADGTLLETRTSLATIITVYSDRSDFTQTLHNAGLWLVFAPGQFTGCFASQLRLSAE